jgi:hypothetical protein
LQEDSNVSGKHTFSSFRAEVMMLGREDIAEMGYDMETVYSFEH